MEAMTTDWNPVLRDQFAEPYWRDLVAFVAEERAHGPVYPPHEDVFAALSEEDALAELRTIAPPEKLTEAPADYAERNAGWLRHHWQWFKDAKQSGDEPGMKEAMQSARFWVPDASTETARCRPTSR